MGMRPNSGHQPPKMTSIRYVSMSPPEIDAARIDKFKALFAEPSLDLSEYEPQQDLSVFQLCMMSLSKVCVCFNCV